FIYNLPSIGSVASGCDTSSTLFPPGLLELEPALPPSSGRSIPAPRLARIMHTLDRPEGGDERNMMGPQNFRVSATAEPRSRLLLSARLERFPVTRVRQWPGTSVAGETTD